MDGFHVTRDLLRAIQESKLPARHLVELAWKHLLEVCPHCRMEWEAWVEERKKVLEPSYDAAFSSAQVNADAAREEEEKERQRAQRDFRELLALPHDRRRQKIHRANKRFKVGISGSRPSPVRNDNQLMKGLAVWRRWTHSAERAV